MSQNLARLSRQIGRFREDLDHEEALRDMLENTELLRAHAADLNDEALLDVANLMELALRRFNRGTRRAGQVAADHSGDTFEDSYGSAHPPQSEVAPSEEATLAVPEADEGVAGGETAEEAHN